MFYVYAYYEPGRAEPFYIGKGQTDRAWDHIQPNTLAKYYDPFHNKLRAMLRDGYTPDIQIIIDELTENEALYQEHALILQYGRKALGTGPLLNCTDGGEGVTGLIHSEETREKIRAKRALQAPPSEEQRIELRKRMIGNQYAKGAQHSLEARCAKSQRQRGRKREGHEHSEESRAQISESLKIAYATGKKRPRRRPVIGHINGQIIKRFASIKEAIDSGYCIAPVVHGKRKLAYGMEWRFE